MSRAGWTLVAVGAVVVAMRSKRVGGHGRSTLRKSHRGARPIEAVGTAVAAFVGLAPGGPVNTP